MSKTPISKKLAKRNYSPAPKLIAGLYKLIMVDIVGRKYKPNFHIIDDVNELMMNLEIEGHKIYVIRGTQHILQDTDRKTIFTNRDSQVKFYHALLKYEIYIEGVE